MPTLRAIAGLALAGLVIGGCASDAVPSSSTGPASSDTPSPSRVEPSVEPTPSEPTPATSVAPPDQPTALWSEVTDTALGTTAEWTNKVEIGDIDGDGRPDLLFANGGDYESPGTAVPVRAFANDGSGAFREVTSTVFGDATFLSRVAKVADVDGDGDSDLVVGGTYGTPTRLFRGAGDGTYTEGAEAVPATPDERRRPRGRRRGRRWRPRPRACRLGRREAPWRMPVDRSGCGAMTEARFAEAAAGNARRRRSGSRGISSSWMSTTTGTSMPSCPARCARVGSCSRTTARAASRTSRPGDCPQFTNNYEFEAMDLDGDGDLRPRDDQRRAGQRATGSREHVLRNDERLVRRRDRRVVASRGEHRARTTTWSPSSTTSPTAMPTSSCGSLFGNPDRLLVNDGTGHLTVVASTRSTRRSLDRQPRRIPVADLDGDARGSTLRFSRRAR